MYGHVFWKRTCPGTHVLTCYIFPSVTSIGSYQQVLICVELDTWISDDTRTRAQTTHLNHSPINLKYALPVLHIEHLIHALVVVLLHLVIRPEYRSRKPCHMWHLSINNQYLLRRKPKSEEEGGDEEGGGEGSENR